MKKGQAALEMLVTYGWMVISLLVVLGALYSFRVFDPVSYMSEKTTDPSADVQVEAHRVDSNSLEVTVKNRENSGVEIKKIRAEGGVKGEVETDIRLPRGGVSQMISVPLTSVNGGEGTMQKFDVIVEYDKIKGIPDKSSTSSLFVRTDPLQPFSGTVLLENQTLIFNDPGTGTATFSVTSQCNVDNARVSISGEPGAGGEPYQYYSLTDEPESDGEAEGFQGTIGDTYNHLMSFGFLVKAVENSEINSFSMNVGYVFNEPELMGFHYSVSICPISEETLLSWEACSGAEETVISDIDVSASFGRTTGWKTINFENLYDMSKSENYMIKFNYLSPSELQNDNDDMWMVKKDESVSNHFMLGHTVSGTTTFYEDMAEIKLGGTTLGAYPSDIILNVSDTTVYTYASDLTSAQTIEIKQEVADIINSCETSQCEIPISVYSETSGEVILHDFTIECA